MGCHLRFFIRQTREKIFGVLSALNSVLDCATIKRVGGKMRFRLFFLAAVWCVTIKGYAKPAILLVGEGGAGRAEKAIESLKDYEFVLPREMIFFHTDECPLDDADARISEISVAIDDASSLFYENAAIKPAEEKLRWALAQMVNAPCAGIGNKRFLKKMFSGSILLIRILLATKNPDAEQVASLVFSRFWFLPLTDLDIPPGVRDFLETHARKEKRKIRVLQKGKEELVVVIDRNIVGQEKEVLADCPQGEHDIAFMSKKGKLYAGKIRLSSDEQTIRVYEPFLTEGFSLQENAIVLPVARLEKTATELSSFLGMPVVVLQDTAEGQVVFEFTEKEKREVFRSVPKEVVSAPVHKKTNLRAWGYAIGGVAVGLLGAGIALNIMANQRVSDINSGHNRIAQFNQYKWASIACYAGAGASGVASLVLILLKKDAVKPQAFGRGVALSFEF